MPRKKGSKGIITKEVRLKLRQLFDDDINKIPDYMAQIEDPRDKLDMIVKFMPYILPKLAPEADAPETKIEKPEHRMTKKQLEQIRDIMQNGAK